jgi:hypothetical protein
LPLEGQGHFSVRERTPVKESYPALAEHAVKKFKDLLLDDKDTWLDMARSWGTILATLHAFAPHDFDSKMVRGGESAEGICRKYWGEENGVE